MTHLKDKIETSCAFCKRKKNDYPNVKFISGCSGKTICNFCIDTITPIMRTQEENTVYSIHIKPYRAPGHRL